MAKSLGGPMARLFESFTLKSVTLRNRIGVSPMCQYSAREGFVTDWHFVHLGALARGGSGLVIMEATAVEPEGRISPGCTGLWSDEQMAPLKKITAFIESQGAVPGIQLHHAGRKASRSVPWQGERNVPLDEGGWLVKGPSAISFGDGFQVPQVLSLEGIFALTQKFAEAAKRARQAGFRWLEIHGAHGYLINNFFSPLSNHRTDEYGGSFENRTRFLFEIIAAVQKEWPSDLPLTVRISATDYAEGGWNLEESVMLARKLKTVGVDLVDCSSGGNSKQVHIPIGPGYQVPFSERIRRESGIRTAAVGLITQPEQAEKILEAGQADLIFLARELLRNPHWPLLAARVLGQKEGVPVPRPYLRSV